MKTWKTLAVSQKLEMSSDRASSIAQTINAAALVYDRETTSDECVDIWKPLQLLSLGMRCNEIK